MAVKVVIHISNECEDIDKANDWVTDVKSFLKDNVSGIFSSSISNRSPREQLTETPPDE